MLTFLPKKLFSQRAAIHTPICIIGGGTAGANLVGHFKYQRGVLKKDIRVFEPSKTHYYQPSFTMVGGGIFKPEKCHVTTRSLIDDAVPITELSVQKVVPESSYLITEDGQHWTYDQLVIVTGINSTFTAIKGASEALNDENCPVGSIYDWQYAKKINQLVEQFKGGEAVFSEPLPPIKCGGAPQKIVFLSLDRWQKNRDSINVSFWKPGGAVFGVPKYSDYLAQLHVEKKVDVKLFHELIEVKGKERIAVFKNVNTKEIIEKKFDLLHVVPPHKPPKFIAESGLSDASGQVEVDKYTFRHTKYPNIWSIGDSANLPTSKTAAAIMSQSPILINNLLAVWRDGAKDNELPARYHGYTSCPIFVGGGKLLLAEFKYAGELDETFGFFQNKPRRFFYFLKAKLFPFVYFHMMKKGLWLGKNGPGRVWY
jgi:eukaryotic sulfide quinone oxidoreductase